MGWFIMLLVVSLGILSVAMFISLKQKKARDAEIERIKSLSFEEKQLYLTKIQMNLKKFETNHIVHLLLTIFCMGFWVIPWFFIAQGNASKRKELERMVQNV